MTPGAVICEACLDAGWQFRECPGIPQQPGWCGRWRDHLPHRYVVPCVCRETNPRYQEKQQQRIPRKRAAA